MNNIENKKSDFKGKNKRKEHKNLPLMQRLPADKLLELKNKLLDEESNNK